jgi:hypothetical protein
MERLCLDCRAPIKGRTDKKFCGDICRSNFNNALKAADYGSLKQINFVLKQNRKILKEKNPDGMIKINREALIKRGFDFDYHTHTCTNQKGETYFYCYEYGYLIVSGDEVLLVKKGINNGTSLTVG